MKYYDLANVQFCLNSHFYKIYLQLELHEFIIRIKLIKEHIYKSLMSACSIYIQKTKMPKLRKITLAKPNEIY